MVGEIPDECKIKCGDGTLDSSLGEECDDYNTLDNDGCSANCTVEEGWTCDTNGCYKVDTIDE